MMLEETTLEEMRERNAELEDIILRAWREVHNIWSGGPTIEILEEAQLEEMKAQR